MYNSEKNASRQNKWVSLLICQLIILGGYLLIRMVFLIFGLQLHLAAQGLVLCYFRLSSVRCIYGSVAKSKKRGFMYSDSCFLLLPRS